MGVEKIQCNSSLVMVSSWNLKVIILFLFCSYLASVGCSTKQKYDKEGVCFQEREEEKKKRQCGEE